MNFSSALRRPGLGRLLCGLCLLAASVQAAPDRPAVIFDTDFRADCDDVGALAVLHQLADAERCDILGVVAGTTGPWIVPAIDAVNTYYGRPDLPIGLSPTPHTEHFDPYAPWLGDPANFPSDQTNATAPDAIALYRRLLFAAADRSVKVVVVGYATCAAGLLQTGADHQGDGIPLTGRELVERKVIELVQMAGVGPGRVDTFNLGHDAEAAVLVEENWPTPILYSAPGRDVRAGAGLSDPARNPVAKAFELYPGAGGRGVIGNRPCWDEIAVLVAVIGCEWDGQEVWRRSTSGSIQFTIRKLDKPKNPAKDTAVKTAFQATPDEGRCYLLQVEPPRETAARIEALLIAPPRR